MMISAIRTVILYLVIIITVRLMGKRQISELQTSELVVTLLMSDIASIPMQNTDQSLLSGIIPIMILLVCEIFISVAMLKMPKLRSLICGKPVTVIKDGIIDQNAMKELRISTEELMEELRQKDIFSIDDVNNSIVETNGKMSVQKKQEKEYVTAEQMKIQVSDVGIDTIVISDGIIADNSLKYCGLSRSWLYNILKKEKTEVKEVFIMTANKNKEYTIIKRAGRS